MLSLIIFFPISAIKFYMTLFNLGSFMLNVGEYISRSNCSFISYFCSKLIIQQSNGYAFYFFFRKETLKLSVNMAAYCKETQSKARK